MSIYQYDPEDWLVSASRALTSYVASLLPQYDVEANYPDTEKLIPMPRPLVHLEQDDLEHPVLGFGVPGVEVIDDVAHTWELHEAQVHHLHFDVGVWVSKEAGGATERMKAAQVLSDAFARPNGKKALQEATGGLWVVNYMGGRNELDRISDTPVWRMIDATVIVRVVSRHIPVDPEVLVGTYEQDQQLTTTNTTGGQSPVN